MTSTATINHIRIATEAIATEAFLGIDLHKLLHESIPNMVHEVKGFFARFTPDQPGIKPSYRMSDFNHMLTNVSYAQLMPLRAYVPEGMISPYIDYLKPLEASAKHSKTFLLGDNQTESILGAYTRFLADIINRPDTPLETSHLLTNIQQMEQQRSKLNQDVGRHFKPGSFRTEVTVADVIKRNADWAPTFILNDEVANGLNMIDRKTLNKKIAEAVTYLDMIIAKIKNHEITLDHTAVNRLSVGTFQAASELEFFSVSYYRSLAMTTAINDTASGVIDAMRLWA